MMTAKKMMDSSPDGAVMRGYMMKRKSAPPSGPSARSLLQRSVGLRWVTRYFVLRRDGKLVYYKDRPDGGGGGVRATVLCHNVGDCTVLRVAPGGVANSFYLAVPAPGTEDPSFSGHGRAGGGRGRRASLNRGASSRRGSLVANDGGRTLLVTNGPGDFAGWIAGFQRFGADIVHGIGDDVMRDVSRSYHVGGGVRLGRNLSPLSVKGRGEVRDFASPTIETDAGLAWNALVWLGMGRPDLAKTVLAWHGLDYPDLIWLGSTWLAVWAWTRAWDYVTVV